MQIRVADTVGSIAITANDGDAVRARIARALRGEDTVELNFDGVSIFASPFFNAAIGQLLGEFEAEDLSKRIQATGLTADGAEIMVQVVKNAREFFSNPKARKAVASLADECAFGR